MISNKADKERNNLFDKKKNDRLKVNLMIILNVKDLNTHTQRQIVRLDIKRRADHMMPAEMHFKYKGTNRAKVEG